VAWVGCVRAGLAKPLATGARPYERPRLEPLAVVTRENWRTGRAEWTG